MNPHVKQNIKLLDEVCFVPFRRQEHELDAMLAEIVRQAAVASHLCVSKADLDPAPEPTPDGT